MPHTLQTGNDRRCAAGAAKDGLVTYTVLDASQTAWSLQQSGADVELPGPQILPPHQPHMPHSALHRMRNASQQAPSELPAEHRSPEHHTQPRSTRAAATVAGQQQCTAKLGSPTGMAIPDSNPGSEHTAPAAAKSEPTIVQQKQVTALFNQPCSRLIHVLKSKRLSMDLSNECAQWHQSAWSSAPDFAKADSVSVVVVLLAHAQIALSKTCTGRDA